MSINKCEKCREHADDGLVVDENGFYVCKDCIEEPASHGSCVCGANAWTQYNRCVICSEYKHNLKAEGGSQ